MLTFRGFCRSILGPAIFAPAWALSLVGLNTALDIKGDASLDLMELGILCMILAITTTIALLVSYTWRNNENAGGDLWAVLISAVITPSIVMGTMYITNYQYGTGVSFRAYPLEAYLWLLIAFAFAGMATVVLALFVQDSRRPSVSVSS